MTSGAGRLARVLADLMVRPGHAFAGQSPELHRPYLEHAIRAGQYLMLSEPSTDRLLGFCCWWLVDDAALRLIREHGAEALCRQAKPPTLTQGRHAHIAAAITAPWAPKSTYLALIDLAKRALSGRVDTISTVMAKRDGRSFWHERRVAA